jgi:AcrR family transcriptional regulator
MSPRAYTLGKREAGVIETRGRVLSATLSLLDEAEPRALTLDEIAGRADVARKTIYYQFGSKQGLISAVVRYIEQESDLVQHIQSIVEDADANDALNSYVREVCRFWISQHRVMRRLHGLASLDADVEQALYEHDEQRRARLVRLVERLANEKGLGNVDSRQQAVEAIWMLSGFATIDHLLTRSRLSAADAENLLSRLAQGLFVC